MGIAKKAWVLALVVCFSLASATIAKREQVTHVKTYYSPVFELGPGDVTDTYKALEWPKGHIAIRSFFAEVVDENGNSVKLTDVYLHHWVVLMFHVKKGQKELVSSVPKTLDMRQSHRERMAFREGADVLHDVIREEKTGTGSCFDNQDNVLWGVGSETRHLNTTLPAPYATVVGDPKFIAEGYEEAWYLNVHAINTIGAVDAIRCLECLCESYGVTEDARGRPLSDEYVGGLRCCYDKTHCAVREDTDAVKRKYYLKYVVTWVEWDESVVPVRTYAFDVTDPRTSLTELPKCVVEYKVPQCSKGSANSECIDHRHSIGAVPIGGDIISGSLHQHYGGLGGILYYKDGPVLCSSEPIYGKGTEPGDEAGYVVGMTTCYPEPGSVTAESMKELHFDAFYSNEVAHTGVMSLFTVHVADRIPYIQEVTE